MGTSHTGVYILLTRSAISWGHGLTLLEKQQMLNAESGQKLKVASSLLGSMSSATRAVKWLMEYYRGELTPYINTELER